MAAPPQTKVVIAGDASGALRAIQDTKTAAQDLGKSAFGPLVSSVNKFQGAIASLSAVLAGGAMFKASISAANEWNKTVGGIARAMGTTSEKASVMAVAMERLGLESDLVVKASTAMTKKLVENEKAFESLGIQTRDLSTGALLPAGAIMGQVNDRLAAIGNGTERNIAGIKLYGEQWFEVRDVLRLTSAELSEAEKRARDLGLVVGSDAVAATRQFKVQLADLELIGKSVQVRFGNELLPAFISFGKYVADQGPVIGKTLSRVFEGAAFAGTVAWETIQQVGRALGALGAATQQILQGNLQGAKAVFSSYQQDSADAEKRIRDLWNAIGETAKKDRDVAAERTELQQERQAKLGDLEFLRAVAAGKASLAVKKDDEKLTQERLANAEKLREALRSAFQQSVEEAREAGEAATALLDKAAQTRQGGKDTAEDIRRSTLDKESQDYLNRREAQDAMSSAIVAALEAKLAAGYGRTEAAARLADRATRDAERAAKLAERLVDPEERAGAVERISEAQALADEARAKIKQQEAAQADQQATTLAEKLKSVEAEIAAIEQRAANIPVNVLIAQAEAALASIQAKLDALQDKTITVTVNQQGNSSLAEQLATFDQAAAASGYAHGGYTGPGAKYQPAGIVHAGEFVLPQEIVRQRGMIAFLTRLLRQGVSALPGFADGGLVGRISLPSVGRSATAAPQRAAVFNFPGIGNYSTTMDPYTFERLQSDFSRAALQKGGRR